MQPTKAGSIRERRPGVFEFRLYVGKDPVTSKHRWVSKTWKGTRRASGKALNDWIVEVRKDQPSTTQTVKWLLDEHMRLLEQLGRSPTTLRTYEGYIKTWLKPHLGAISLEDLTAGDVRRLEAAMTSDGKKASSIRQAHAILRGALRFAEENEWVNRNVAALARPPKQQRSTVVAPTPDEVNRLYNAAGIEGSDLATAIALGATLGRRLGELCALRWSDIDFEAGTVTIASSAYVLAKDDVKLKDTKTHQAITMVGGLLAMDRLRSRLAYQRAYAERVGVELVGDPFVLSRNADGSGPPRPDGYSTSFGDLRDNLDLTHIHFHSLRHFAGTYLADDGVDLLTIARRLGHADATMIARVYGHGTERADKAASTVLGDLLELQKPRSNGTPESPVRLPNPEGGVRVPEKGTP